MSMICLLARRHLAVRAALRSQPERGWVARHVDHCATCQTERAAYLAISQSLDGLGHRAGEPVSPEAVLRRMGERPAASPVRRWALVPAAIAALALGVLWLAGSRRGESPSRRTPAPRPTVVARRHAPCDPLHMAPAPTQGRTKASTKRGRTPTRRIRRHSHQRVQPTVLARRTPTPSASETAMWGAYLENAGDFRRASVAYDLAYQKAAAPELAFAAGRAAESDGAIERALAYYTTLLTTPVGDRR